MTGLAGGDHLHFTMLVGGRAGESGRMVGSALDSGPGRAQAGSGARPSDAPGLIEVSLNGRYDRSSVGSTL